LLEIQEFSHFDRGALRQVSPKTFAIGFKVHIANLETLNKNLVGN